MDEIFYNEHEFMSFDSKIPVLFDVKVKYQNAPVLALLFTGQ